jgi:ornithine decarboxylase
VGYEQFIPMMADCSPLLLELTPDDPGIFVTQSVHKQQAGFSQTSQIHKRITICAARRASVRTSG